MNLAENYNDRIFDTIKHIDEYGNEYWEARGLQRILEYNKCENFLKVIYKAIIALDVAENKRDDWLLEVNKPIITGKGKQEFIKDYKLSRYICYLIVQNGDPRKKVIALGQKYFAIQTRRQEINENEFKVLSEDEKRLYIRKQTRDGNYSLQQVAKKSWSKEYGEVS